MNSALQPTLAVAGGEFFHAKKQPRRGQEAKKTAFGHITEHWDSTMGSRFTAIKPGPVLARLGVKYPGSSNESFPRRPVAAFSLIEVMVAVFILAVALVGMARGIGTALISSKEAETYTQAVQLAAARAEFLRADDLFADGETTGTEGNLKWRQTISTANVNGLHDVEIVIQPATGDTTLYSLRTLLYQTPVDRQTEKEKSKDKERSRRGSTKRK